MRERDGGSDNFPWCEFIFLFVLNIYFYPFAILVQASLSVTPNLQLLSYLVSRYWSGRHEFISIDVNRSQNNKEETNWCFLRVLLLKQHLKQRNPSYNLWVGYSVQTKYGLTVKPMAGSRRTHEFIPFMYSQIVSHAVSLLNVYTKSDS